MYTVGPTYNSFTEIQKLKSINPFYLNFMQIKNIQTLDLHISERKTVDNSCDATLCRYWDWTHDPWQKLPCCMEAMTSCCLTNWAISVNVCIGCLLAIGDLCDLSDLSDPGIWPIWPIWPILPMSKPLFHTAYKKCPIILIIACNHICICYLNWTFQLAW